MIDVVVDRRKLKSGAAVLRYHALDDQGQVVFGIDYDDSPEILKGRVTCVDCYLVIKFCKSIPEDDILPEFEDDLLDRRLKKNLKPDT